MTESYRLSKEYNLQFSINGIFIKILKKLGETIVSNEKMDESTEDSENNIA